MRAGISPFSDQEESRVRARILPCSEQGESRVPPDSEQGESRDSSVL
jgi:hypothetical protein